MRIERILGLGMLAMCSLGWAQPPKPVQPVPPVAPIPPFEQPDAQRTRDEMSRLLERYPPSLRAVLGVDPSLLDNQPFLATYPALASFLNTHPEIGHNPFFYIGASGPSQFRGNRVADAWQNVMGDFAGVIAFGMGVGLLGWLVRTLVDYRRWNRLTSTQTEFHTKLIDRFSANNDLLAYIQSPAGTRFLQSTPLALDAAPRSMGAPLGRILWSVQGGVVLIAAGIGLWVVSGQVGDDGAQPLHALGVIGIALGIGFAVSAIISFLISRRLGLIEARASGVGSGTQE
jgi:hypothetical protein